VRLTAEQIKEIKELYENGYSRKYIAKKFNITVVSVSYWTKGKGDERISEIERLTDINKSLESENLKLKRENKKLKVELKCR
jgi:predicted transcriptional regulator